MNARLDALELAYDTAGRVLMHVGREQRRIAQTIDRIRLAERPTFPTSEQRAGLTEAARRLREGTPAKTHHGDPTPTYAVVVEPGRRWLSIRDGAPYSVARRGNHLWSFTDDEVSVLLGEVESLGFTVVDHWRHAEGLSVVVAP